MKIRRLAFPFAIVMMMAGVAGAQTAPDPCAGKPATGACAWQRANLNALTVLPPLTFDWSDGAGGDLSYGGGAFGVSEDGRAVYLSCNNDQNGIAKLALPTTGTRLTVLDSCKGIRLADLRKLHPDQNATKPQIGGVLEQGGRIVVTGFISYDASGSTVASHWMGPDLSNLAGPFAGSVQPGLVKDEMAAVPPEWRQLLGGPAFSTAGYTSIIGRASQRAAVSIFDPATVTANGFPMKMLLGCPSWVAGCNTWTAWGPSTNEFNGAELWGGAFIIPNTRTLVAIEREGTGTVPPGGTVPHEGYGLLTTDITKHGSTVTDAAGVTKNLIYSLSDPAHQGNKAYPYRLVAKLFDLYDLVEVREGRKAPETVKQYATIDLPGSSPSEFVTSGAYNPVTGEYLFLRSVGGGTNTIHRIGGFAAGQAPPPPPPPTPPSGGISVDQTQVPAGTAVTISWNQTGADTAAITPRIGTVTGASGTATDIPQADTTYTLTLGNAGGTVSYTASVAVVQPPPPPPDPCQANPIVITAVSWPGNAEGARQGRFTWSVANDVVTLVEAKFNYPIGGQHSLTITDSRGCTFKYDR